MTKQRQGFGEWLAEAIEQAGLKRSEFARKAGVTRGTVTNWIRAGEKPGADTLKRIAVGLGVRVEIVEDWYDRDFHPDHASMPRLDMGQMSELGEFGELLNKLPVDMRSHALKKCIDYLRGQVKASRKEIE